MVIAKTTSLPSFYSDGSPPPRQRQPLPQQPSLALNLPPKKRMASPVRSAIVDENLVVMDYNPPGTLPPLHNPNYSNNNNNNATPNNPLANKTVQWVYNPSDGSVLRDHNGLPLSVDRLLATKPLKHELSTRPGPGNKKLTYISGDDVSRTLNDVFGFDGWNLDIREVEKMDISKCSKSQKYTVVYTARVRVTHKASGTYKEDCGAGDSTDKVYATAIAHALKASITDAMKRAARHFGDKLGNSLYSGNFSINKAPVTLRDALDKYDIHRCNTKFGFQKPSATMNAAAPTASKQMVTNNSASVGGSMPPPSKPPPTTNFATANTVARNDTAIAAQQYHNPRQPQQQASVSINHYPQQQKQSAPSNIPPSNGLVQAESGLKAGSISTEMNTSGMTRPTSSYGRRPTLGSNVPGNNGHSGAISAKVASSGTGPIPTAANTEQPFHPNNDNTSNSRRVSLDQKLRRQALPLPLHTSQSSANNVTSNVSSVSQTPSVHGSGGNHNNTDNSYAYGNAHKRPPLGAIGPNPSAKGIWSSESSSKRPKQQIHHNPYNNQSVSGRKSI